SRDGGNTWTGVMLNSGRVTALVVDPLEPNVLFAGTLGHRYAAGGVYKSINGGRGWVPVPSVPATTSLTIDPVESHKVYAGTLREGIYKSTDSGQTWRVVGAEFRGRLVQALTSDPRRRDTLYASVGNAPSNQVYKSTDGGETWRPAGAGLDGRF